jgi:hypothetical protein
MYLAVPRWGEWLINKKGLQETPQSLDFQSEPGRIRTFDPLIKSQLLCQLSYRPIREFGVQSLVSSFSLNSELRTLNSNMARLRGFEPPTLGSGGRCSDPLSYRRIGVSEGIRTPDPLSHSQML